MGPILNGVVLQRGDTNTNSEKQVNQSVSGQFESSSGHHQRRHSWLRWRCPCSGRGIVTSTLEGWRNQSYGPISKAGSGPGRVEERRAMTARDALNALGVFAVVALATVIVLALIAIFTGAAVGAFLFILAVVAIASIWQSLRRPNRGKHSP